FAQGPRLVAIPAHVVLRLLAAEEGTGKCSIGRLPFQLFALLGEGVELGYLVVDRAVAEVAAAAHGREDDGLWSLLVDALWRADVEWLPSACGRRDIWQ